MQGGGSGRRPLGAQLANGRQARPASGVVICRLRSRAVEPAAQGRFRRPRTCEPGATSRGDDRYYGHCGYATTVHTAVGRDVTDHRDDLPCVTAPTQLGRICVELRHKRVAACLGDRPGHPRGAGTLPDASYRSDRNFPSPDPRHQASLKASPARALRRLYAASETQARRQRSMYEFCCLRHAPAARCRSRVTGTPACVLFTAMLLVRAARLLSRAA